MRYLIIGAGAVGGTIGGRLHQAGHDVLLVARGPHLAALRAGGLRLTVPDGTHRLPVPAVGGPDEVELAPDDVLLLAVKTQHSTALLEQWAPRPVAGGGTAAERLPLVCAQNGVENERLALRRFERVYGMCVWLPSAHLEPGAVSAAGSPCSGVLHLGRYPHAPHHSPGTDAATDGTDATAARIAADLAGAHFDAYARPDVMAWKYAKLLSNLGNALEAVAGPIDGELRMRAWRRVRAEGEAVLAAAGIAHPSEEEQQAVRGERVTLLPLPGAVRGGGSSWQSLARGTGDIEADYLNGEIVLLGRLHGVPAPLNAALQRLAAEFARTGRPAGSLPDADLAALLDAS
ncbi:MULTISPECIES: 2-dehydropantoate 2-reductase N-terminal domain-containing protein [Kitasatospora]|uniref:Putative ketopantoate reductase PanE/ApbA family protein n=1 Tax=Kitasatospora setae (strain ATCC 33774 / DSM 43861 / JCM 3304 / KCC A-0304 / NBRC 14216 / KM-6054) TaxID=452652 RepID=E4N807_KITSK|nr:MULTISPECIES: 2-dehydropantoate 2-reductase N-terminal domain-containing protein [Kitasatospora]BAJ27338.1 putative ketopantoate reductase PanE/ApbA family protein [Kitasatospora setae KM-6054]